MKFIHTGDIHLGASPDIGFPWSGAREKEIWESFKQLIVTIQQEKIDLLLIAGDFFHRQPLIRELKEVNYLFSAIPDTQVVLMAGNHDYLKRDSYYKGFPWASNVVGLWEESCEVVYLASIKTWVYGLSYYGREIMERKYQGVKPNGKPGIHILLAHGGDDKHIPIAMDELAGAGFDYVALGHIHLPRVLIKDRMAYCGALEPLDRNDIGKHGYMKGEWGNHGVRARFVPAAVRGYIPLMIQVESDTTQFSLEQQVKEEIEILGKHNIFNLALAGYRDQDINFNHQYLMKVGNIISVCDNTSPDYDLEKMSRQYRGSLIGAYIDRFAKDETVVGKQALYYGLHAMLEAKKEPEG